jgi:hypothetical protein
MSEAATELIHSGKTARGTPYQILRDNGENNYRSEGVVVAVNATEAVRRHAEQMGEGTYYAIPSRSWQAHTAVVETVPRIKVG